MKIIAILGGLGSQMFKYAFYYALSKKEPGNVAIDTTFYLQNQSWNGYELKKLFNVTGEDIQGFLSKKDISVIEKQEEDYLTICLSYLFKSRAAYYYMGKCIHSGDSINKSNIRIINLKKKILMTLHLLGKDFEYRDSDLRIGINAYYDEYAINSDSLFSDYKEEIRSVFQFPKLDEKNQYIASRMEESASVAIHVRRSDHLLDNIKLFKNGFFKKSVEYIKNNETKKLVFYIFSEDIDWCKTNLKVLGLDISDSITFVDWNSGKDSYKDMQLMTYCKHNIIPISSFSWWGYYLSNRKNKIVCAPKGYWIEIANHF